MAIRLMFSTSLFPKTASLADLGDGHLLALFAAGGDSAEDAFTTLVERHGPMVFRAARSLLRDEHEAQDVLQATFLVLARKARRVWVRESLGSWLHGVACHIARDVRKASARRQAREQKVRAMSSKDPLVLAESADGRDAAAALHEEIARLPEPHRAAVVLCDLQGRTHAEAAEALGWPVGTVKSRQARAREQLRGRLARRGVALSSGALVALLTFEGKSAVAAPPELTRSMVRAALRFSSGGAPAVAGIVSSKVLEQASRAALGMTIAWLMPISTILFLLAAAVVLAGRTSGTAGRGPMVASRPAEQRSIPTGSLAGLRWKPEPTDAWDPEVTDEEHAPFHAFVRKAKSRASRRQKESAPSRQPKADSRP